MSDPTWLMLLRSAGTLGESFTKPELVVAAWRDGDGAFSLAGYPEHCDSNAVAAKLYGARGLIGRGYVEPFGAAQFRVTDAGRAVIANGAPKVKRALRLVEVFAELRVGASHVRFGAEAIGATVAPRVTTLGPGFIGVPR